MVRRDQLARLEAHEVVGELLRRRVAQRRIARHRLFDDGDEVARHARLAPQQRLRPFGQHTRQRLRRRSARVRRRAREQVIEDGADGVDVGALVDGLALGLLGRHVRRRAEDGADFGGVVVVRRHHRVGGDLAAAREILGQPPVDEHGLAEAADEHVGGLEVAVDDALAVRVGHRLGDGDDVGQERQAIGERLGLLHDLVERAARHQLHGVERLARGPAAGFVDGDDRRMLQARGDQRLADEAARGFGADADELLDGDVGRPRRRSCARKDAADAAARELVAHVVALIGHERQHRGDDFGDGGRGGGVIGRFGERRRPVLLLETLL